MVEPLSHPASLVVLQKNIFVADLTEEMVTTPAQALAWISKGESKVLFFFFFLSDLHISLAVNPTCTLSFDGV